MTKLNDCGVGEIIDLFELTGREADTEVLILDALTNPAHRVNTPVPGLHVVEVDPEGIAGKADCLILIDEERGIYWEDLGEGQAFYVADRRPRLVPFKDAAMVV